MTASHKWSNESNHCIRCGCRGDSMVAAGACRASMTDELPPLPEPVAYVPGEPQPGWHMITTSAKQAKWWRSEVFDSVIELHTAEQLRAYALQAVAAERKKLLSRLAKHYGNATALHLEFAAIRATSPKETP